MNAFNTSVCIAAHSCVLVAGNQTLVGEVPATFLFAVTKL